MSLQNIKASNRGFTIVELLIVVVVIAILAAITIISYNGITSRANASSAASNVETVQKVAEAYNSDCSVYPSSIAQFRSGCTTSNGQTITAAAKLPSSIDLVSPITSTTTIVNTTTAAALANIITITGSSNAANATPASGAGTNALSASNGTTRVAIYVTGSSAAPTGGVIISWNYSAGAVTGASGTSGNNQVSSLTYFGAATSTSTFFAIN